MNILIDNVEIFQDDRIRLTNVLIQDGKITHIEDDKQNLPQNIKVDKTILGKDKFAIPGFVNTHTHAAMTLLRSYADDMVLMDWLQNKIWPAEANLTKEDVYWGTKLAIAEMFRSGTTCFADMYFEMEQVAMATQESGMRADLSRGIVGVGPDVDKKLADGVDFCRNWQDAAQGLITTRLGPHAPYTCPPDIMKRVIEIARRENFNIHMHLSETKGEVDTCLEKFGLTPIALMDSLGLFDLNVLAAHCVHVTESDIKIMQQKNVCVAHNPQSNLKLASGIAPLKAMLQAGVAVGLGTDGPSSNNNLDILEEVRLAALLHKNQEQDPQFLPAYDALKLGTEWGAKVLGLKNVGRLEVGYQADIVLLDTTGVHWSPNHNKISTLVYAANCGDVDTVMVAGKIVLENKQLTTIDLERTIHEVETRGKRLAQ